METRRSSRHLPIIDDVVLAPLKPAGLFGGRQAVAAGDEILFSNDSLIGPLQAYPGEQLPDPASRKRFPVPDRPGEYCGREEFERSSKFMAQFVHWPRRLETVLEGRYFDLAPVHFEGIFTLVCNFMCPHCTRRVTRTRWVEGGAWDYNTPIEKKNTMHPGGLRRTLDEAASLMEDRQMGIVWGGGDPTANPFTYDAMLYATGLGITSSFLTNGVFLEVDPALDPDPILIRISLNCGTEEAYRKFHGYPKGWDYFDRVKQKMRELARRKLERKARTLVGISLIIDERNLEDVIAATEEIRRVVDEVGGGVDYVIVRPVMNYKHFEQQWARLKSDTKQRAHDLISEDGAVWEILKSIGVPLVPIKDSFEAPPSGDADFYSNGECLAYGVCSEIRHNGDVQICSDSYGNPEYTIGNLYESSLQDIWQSDHRRQVLAKLNERQCFKTYCPHNSRGHHYNRLFHLIEKKRSEGKIDEVRQWAGDLREVTYALGHSFFI